MTPDDLDRLLAAATPAPWETASIGPDHKIIAIVQREDGDWVPVAVVTIDPYRLRTSLPAGLTEAELLCGYLPPVQP